MRGESGADGFGSAASRVLLVRSLLVAGAHLRRCCDAVCSLYAACVRAQNDVISQCCDVRTAVRCLTSGSLTLPTRHCEALRGEVGLVGGAVDRSIKTLHSTLPHTSHTAAA